jgi:hypothetical protein
MFSALKVSQFDLSRNVGNGAALLPPMPKLSTLTLSPEQGVLTVKIRQPSHEFTFGVGMNFIPYPLVLTPVV